MKIIRNGKIARLAAGGGPGGGARLKAECQRLKTLYREETFNAKRSTSNFQGWRTKRWCLPRSGPDWRVPGVWTGGNLAKLKPIKVNQGEIFPEKEEAQEEVEGSRTDCGDEPSPPRRRWFPDSLCAKPAVGGARIYENLAKLKRIKVDQGDKFLKKLKGRMRRRVIWSGVGTGRPHPEGCRTRWWIACPYGKITCHKVSRSERDKVCRSATDSTSYGWQSDPVHLEGQRGLWESMGHNGSYFLLNMSGTIRLRCASAYAKAAARQDGATRNEKEDEDDLFAPGYRSCGYRPKSGRGRPSHLDAAFWR